ncbi:TPA: hypothetical protein HA239_04245 [Candidatus Woesearchaeota archaeon]|nr:hypothetical protein QT06_C0001G0732 [archaeon GW2011_AR15]MBS3103483.1 hypothetical protein [Candidatus Woesearchaeota archaeon]HIH41601.1 hypothetical protein [Candidatus Woesearchaeota archaeon]
MATFEQLEKDIKEIKERNKKVEADKAWETSWARRILVAVLTYAIIAYFFYLVGLPNPLANAFVPMIAFVLSTLTLSFAKKLWVDRVYKK